MYLLLIRPQQRRVAQARALMESLQVGEKVVTAGGMIGTIEDMDERTVSLRVAPDVVLTFIRPAVTRRYEEADDSEDADVNPEEQE
jgi:preprotein translocase subunit YajC